MSSSGITAINSGPIILRTCLNSSSKTVVLTDYDYPVSSNRVLITSTSGYVIPSDNIYISSITSSTINTYTINTSTINTYTINASTINTSTINTRTINSSTINTSSINTSAINLSTLNGSPYGFNTVVSPPISIIFTNSSLYTVPPNTSSITFTLIGAGGSSNTGGGGGGSGVTLTINNPSNSVFALYPGISSIGSGLGGGMSMLFSVNGNNYTCIAVAGGGGGAANYGGGGGGSNGSGLYINSGGRAGSLGGGGAGGIDTSGGDGNPGSNFNGLLYPGITFPTILVGGGGGTGGYVNAGTGGNGGDGYGGGGGGAANYSGDTASGGGGGNYCYTGGNVTNFSIVNGNNGTDLSGVGGAPGIIIGNYGYGGTVPYDGQPGVIQVDYNSYVNESLYDLIPSTTQTLGSLVSPWSTIFTSSITMTGIISTSGFKVSGLQTTGSVSNLYYDINTNEITYGVSMAKYKSNIVDLSLDTTSIYNLNPREYDYLDGKHCVGFIAEEVDEVDTMLAAKSGDGKPENINWYGLTTYLVHEMKKLNERVKTLERVML